MLRLYFVNPLNPGAWRWWGFWRNRLGGRGLDIGPVFFGWGRR